MVGWVIRSPRFGVGRSGSPRFVPICSDFPVFFRFCPICSMLFSGMPRFVPICSDLLRFLPICSDLFRFAPFSSDLFRFVPICSVFFRFVPICSENKSEQIRETPFCRPLLKIPEPDSTIPLWAKQGLLQCGMLAFCMSEKGCDAPATPTLLSSVWPLAARLGEASSGCWTTSSLTQARLSVAFIRGHIPLWTT